MGEAEWAKCIPKNWSECIRFASTADMWGRALAPDLAPVTWITYEIRARAIWRFESKVESSE